MFGSANGFTTDRKRKKPKSYHHGLKLLARMPIDPRLAQLVDAGQIEKFEGNWLASTADIVESFGN